MNDFSSSGSRSSTHLSHTSVTSKACCMNLLDTTRKGTDNKWILQENLDNLLQPAERCSTTVCYNWQCHDLAAKLLCCNSLAAASYVIHTNNGHPFRSRSNDKSERECKGGGCDQIGIFLEYSNLIWRVRRGVHTIWFLLFWGIFCHYYGRLLTTG